MSTTRTRPYNLLVILWDELQRRSLGMYGGPVATPACDRLATRGIVLDKYYCACPLCVPTRPSMLGGRWPHAHGSTSFGSEHELLNPGEELLTDHLLDAGYHVGYEGIWHVNRRPADERRAEFAHFNSTGFAREQYRDMLLEQGGKDGDQYATVSLVTDTDPVAGNFSIPVPACWTGPVEEHADMQHALRIAEFIETAPADRPFAAWCSFGAPHPPLLVPEEAMRRFSADDVSLPPGFGEDRSGMPEAVAEAPGYQAVADWDWDRWAPAIAAYHAFVAFGDACIHVLLEALARTGHGNDTLVLMSCDHGEMLGAHSMYQKGCMYEDAIRLPFVIAGPGLPSGRRSQLAGQVDMAPTILDGLGLEPLSNAQGVSLMPMLLDPEKPGNDYTFSEFNGHIDGGFKMRCCVSDRYKYVYYHGDPIDQLFDLRNDPHELRDLAGLPGYAPLRSSMRRTLATWMRDTGDSLVPVPKWPE